MQLRKQNYSVYEISHTLHERHCPLSPTGVREVLRACLAFKLWSIERKSHVMAWVADEGLALFAGLARLDQMQIPFITLRRRSPRLLKEIALLPRSAWRTIELEVPTRKYRSPRVYEQTITVAGRRFRQMFVQDLGHDEPTILLTNQRHVYRIWNSQTRSGAYDVIII